MSWLKFKTQTTICSNFWCNSLSKMRKFRRLVSHRSSQNKWRQWLSSSLRGNLTRPTPTNSKWSKQPRSRRACKRRWEWTQWCLDRVCHLTACHSTPWWCSNQWCPNRWWVSRCLNRWDSRWCLNRWCSIQWCTACQECQACNHPWLTRPRCTLRCSRCSKCKKCNWLNSSNQAWPRYQHNNSLRNHRTELGAGHSRSN